MILTVTPNAAVDKTYQVEDFGLDRVHRPTATHTIAGGKGINLARVYTTLGGQAVTTGFLGGAQGQMVAKALSAEQLSSQFVPCEGETRLCIAIVDPVLGTQTEINELGPQISARSVSNLLRRVKTLLSQEEFDFVVMCGSLPPGVPDTLFAEIVSIAKAEGVRTVLDSSGAALREGIAAIPWMVKPNRAELRSIASGVIESAEDSLGHARRLQQSGIAVVAVTLGSEGALLVCEGGTVLRAMPPNIEFVSAVASGDAFLGGFLWAWSSGEIKEDAEYSLRIASGAGAANAAIIGAGICDRGSILECAARVEIKAWN